MKKNNPIQPIIFGDKPTLVIPNIEVTSYGGLIFNKNGETTKLVDGPNPYSPILELLETERVELEKELDDPARISDIDNEWATTDYESRDAAIVHNGFIIFYNGFLTYVSSHLDLSEYIVEFEKLYERTITASQLWTSDTEWGGKENDRIRIDMITASVSRVFARFYSDIIDYIITNNLIDKRDFVEKTVVAAGIMEEDDVDSIGSEQLVSFAYTLLNELASNDIVAIVDMVRTLCGRSLAVRKQYKIQSDII